MSTMSRRKRTRGRISREDEEGDEKGKGKNGKAIHMLH
jgi:hypothetical protein